ncbi:MAG TPA: hypothetical protein PLH94_09840 [Fimbriimonadaceae bacterium]|nr:hypothetical protein [Fimbriimonadaceae bacterium]
MIRLTTLFFLLVVAVAAVSAQPGRTRQKPTVGLLPYMEQSNFKGFQNAFLTQLTASLKSADLVVMPPKETLARFRKSGIDPHKYVANAKAFTGSDEELGALIAWLQAQKSSKNQPGKVVVNLIDTSTGEIVWADEFLARGRDDAKAAADRLAAAIKKRRR